MHGDATVGAPVKGDDVRRSVDRKIAHFTKAFIVAAAIVMAVVQPAGRSLLRRLLRLLCAGGKGNRGTKRQSCHQGPVCHVRLQSELTG